MPHVLVNGPASWNTLIRLPALPDPRSQTLFASSHHDGLGGTSAGKALTLAALGVDVTLRTAIGDDGEGSRVRAALAHPRISLVVQEVAATERHVNLMADDGARVSLYLELPSPGPGPVPWLDGVDAAVLDLADHSRPLLAAARAAGVPVWCDVHDDDGLADYPRDFAAAADVLLVSAARLTDPRAYLSGAVARGCRRRCAPTEATARSRSTRTGGSRCRPRRWRTSSTPTAPATRSWRDCSAGCWTTYRSRPRSRERRRQARRR